MVDTASDRTPLATTYLLPPEAYHSEEWFEREKAELFQRAWMYVTLEHDVAEPGDFFTDTIGNAPIVVVRDRDGSLRAFHNMCRHRGLPLLEGDGNCGKSIVCPYHRWNFGTDGTLRAVPQKEQYPDLDFADLGLYPVRCETWKGMIFVNLEPSGESLLEWLDTFPSKFTRFDPLDLVDGFRVTHPIKANWKLYVENHVDWLHLWYLHADTLSFYDHSKGELAEHGRHWTSFEGPYADDEEERKSELIPIPGLEGSDQRNGAHLLFPTVAIVTHADYWMVWKLSPLTATTSELDLRVLVMPGSDGSQIGPGLEMIMQEDYSASEAIQRAVKSPVYEVGPMAHDYEHEITRFQKHILEFFSL